MDTGSIMTYKGYSALIKYSEEDDCLIGRVLGISDIISFEGESVSRVRQEFKDSVEDYLALCKEEGKEPERPYSGRVVVRLPSALHEMLSLAAESQGITLNDVIVQAVTEAYSNQESKGRAKGRRTRKAVAV